MENQLNLRKRKKMWEINDVVMESIEERYPLLATLIKAENGDRTSRHISKQKRFEVLKRQGWCCNICGCKLKYSKGNEWVAEIGEIDHIHPYSKKEFYPRGEEFINELENLQALCPSCNKKKSDKEVQ